ncbi:hypothetical protein KQ715_15835, partial [Listeria monocytogenes]|nr:hypothetical protein [Listeria monocytogenes]
ARLLAGAILGRLAQRRVAHPRGILAPLAARLAGARFLRLALAGTLTASAARSGALARAASVALALATTLLAGAALGFLLATAASASL